MDTIQSIKQRFEIIGNDPKLNRAIEKAIQVAPTDISVLVAGESGVGKENIPKIIHSLSHRKHGKYIAVNCGAIPEGTIDSELFGHEKGSFTGATSERQGYFEVADGGTIFLDEVGELPLTTQVRLLRVLENGEFIKVGSSQVQKTNVRIVAATNVNMFSAIEKGKFREDLYYRLSTVDITLPPLRDRAGDIHLLFRKFASDFAYKYKMPAIKLDDNAIPFLQKYRWSGNIRQLRNVAEQISVLETTREITIPTLQSYLPVEGSNLPSVIKDQKKEKILQYGQRVFGLSDIPDDDLVEQAIQDTETFFQRIGMPTHFSDYGIDAQEAAQKILERFIERETKIGEQPHIYPGDVVQILLAAA